MLINKQQFKNLKNISRNTFILSINIKGHLGIKESSINALFTDNGILIDQFLINKAFISYQDITDIKLQSNVIFIKSNDNHAQNIQIILYNCNYEFIFNTIIQKINIVKNSNTNYSSQQTTNNSYQNDNIMIEKSEVLSQIDKEKEQLYSLQSKIESLEKTFQIQKNKIEKSKELYKSMNYCIDKFFYEEFQQKEYNTLENDIDELSPSITLKLHSMDVKTLKKEFKENDKYIDKILKQYSERYSTKANKAIYELMVIGLRAELQNILYNLKYEKLDVAIEQVKSMTQKYLKIASDGNQTIVSTLVKFIGEIEYFFINAVKIEYNYYVKKEQARQEQLAIRQQMREEAEERQQLLNQQKQIEKEETKYNNEIEKITSLLSENTDSDKIAELQAKLIELQSKLSDVTIKKDEIVKLQNGKAGHVYIISNIGSFGENVFKIGMTRRLDPQERVDELGSASVPFKFDVHSFIFSDDAVYLEKKLHTILNTKRVNKVNLRKEFFNINIDELENLITEIEPTAEFIKTIQAQEFNESLSSIENYSIDEKLVGNYI